jgi:ketosteroid isomerase-like protein
VRNIGNTLWQRGLQRSFRIAALAAAVAFSVVGQTGNARAAEKPEPKSATEAHQNSADSDQLEHLIATYAKSIDTADTALASQIWSSSPDVSFIHPLGHEHGLEEVKQNVYERMMGDTFSERKLKIRDVSLHIYRDTAWAEFYWVFEAKLRKDGSPLTTKGRETQVYHKEGGEWRLVHVHYSGMPVAEERRGF